MMCRYPRLILIGNGGFVCSGSIRRVAWLVSDVAELKWRLRDYGRVSARRTTRLVGDTTESKWRMRNYGRGECSLNHVFG